MVCDKCGTEVTKNDKFCPKCGAKVIKKRNKKKDIPEVEKYTLKDKEIEHLSQSFVSRDEKYIASLGNGYIMNYLTNKSMKKGFAFLTDKRVYFKGTCLSGKGKFLVRTDEERTVDVKNITGSGFVYRRYLGIIIAMFISLLAALAGTVGIAWYEVAEADYGICRIIEYNPHDHELINFREAILDYLDEVNLEEISDEFNDTISYNNEDYNIQIEQYNDDEIEIIIYKNDDELYDWNGSSIDSITHDIEEYIENRENKIKDRNIKGIFASLGRFVIIGLCLPFAVICCIGIKNYLLKRKTLFRIEYAGGCIAFDVSFYAKAEIDDFQKQLRRIKDFAEETTTIKTVTVETPIQAPTQSSVPDDLRKYADLLKEGLISQEEYDAMKKKILGL